MATVCKRHTRTVSPCERTVGKAQTKQQLHKKGRRRNYVGYVISKCLQLFLRS